MYLYTVIPTTDFASICVSGETYSVTLQL